MVNNKPVYNQPYLALQDHLKSSFNKLEVPFMLLTRL